MKTQALEERLGLYYPYVHIRDDEWLKKTLLVFPGLVRMIASEMTPDDGALVQQLSEGRNGRRPLLTRARLWGDSIMDAQRDLIALIDRDLTDDRDGFLAKFGVISQDRSGRGFQMHLGKTSAGLSEFLVARGLAWVPDHPDHRDYHQLHPRLGQAVLGTIAVACAKDEGFDIVAHSSDEPSVELNQCLGVEDAGAVYRRLIHGEGARADRQLGDTQLLETVIFCNCDVSGLDAAGLIALSDERDALRALKEELHSLSLKVPTMENPDALQARLQDEAHDVLRRWSQNRANLSAYAREVFGIEPVTKGSVEVMKTAMEKLAAPTAIAGASVAAATTIGSAPIVVAGMGIALGFLAHAVTSFKKVRDRETTGPLRFLTGAAKRGVVFSLGK